MELAFKNLDRLDAIAEEDEIYQAWYQSHQDLRRDFKEYAKKHPLEIYHMLWAYADTGDMVLQRKVLLACENMEFKKNKKRENTSFLP